MSAFEDDIETRLIEAARLIEGGQKKQARQILRTLIHDDPGHLTAWELMLGACFTPQEEITCLQKILALNPHHPWAAERLARTTSAASRTHPPAPPHKKQKVKKRQPALIPIMAAILGVFMLVCLAVWSAAIFKRLRPPAQTALELSPTVSARPAETPLSTETCENLIQKAIEASGQACDRLGPNSACYGNNTVQAELISGTTQHFSEPGDIITVDQLNKLSAAPLDLNAKQWGIVVFNVMANLPRSLPGETVTMVAFGNTSLENGGDNLQTFYFSSQLGQVVCDQAPRDGIVISTPQGVSIKFNINGSELTLAGDANLQATAGGEMQVSLYSGTGQIVANGQAQVFGAGQKVTVELGGENGLTASSAPSEPQPLAPEDLQAACIMTGTLCDTTVIPTADLAGIQQTLEAELGFTPTPTLTFTPSPTEPPTLTPLPSETPVPTASPSPTATPTRTRAPRPRPTQTSEPPPTNPPPAPTATIPFTPTATASPTATVIVPCADVSASALTINNNELQLTISNNHGAAITLNSLSVNWVQVPPAQALLAVLLNGTPIFAGSEPLPPSSFPAERLWDPAASRLIADGTSATLILQFNDTLQSTGYAVQAIFDISCDINSSN